MRIAIVIEHFDATRGGAEHVAVWIAGELTKRGHKVDVLCHDANRRLKSKRTAATQGASHDADRSANSHGREEAAAPAGVHIHKIRGLKLSSGIGFRLFGRRAAKWCQEHQPDVVHSLTVAWAGDIYHPEAGVYARMQEQAVASRGTQAKAQFKRWMQRLSGKQRSLLALEKQAVAPWEQGGPWRIISISEGMSRELAAHYQIGAERWFRLDNPRIAAGVTGDAAEADRKWFRAHYGLEERDRVALFVGHDFRRKGLKWAIEAVARTESQWKLLVVGLGKVRDYFEQADTLGLMDRVKFVGPTREVARLYHAADALLLPVFYDPAPLVVIEALSAGLPVISTRNLGSADIVEDHRAGVIVESPHDVAALAKALDTLPVKPSEYAALQARARKAAEGLPGDAFMEKLIALYTECIKAKLAQRS